MTGNMTIRRDYILEDAYLHLIINKKNPRNVLRIQFVDQNEVAEMGMDGGGLFKEFMTLVTQKIFDP